MADLANKKVKTMADSNSFVFGQIPVTSFSSGNHFSLFLSLSLSHLPTNCNNFYYNQEQLMSKTKPTFGFVESQRKVVELELEVTLPGLIKTCQMTLELHRFAFPFRSLPHQFLLILPVLSVLMCVFLFV